MYAFPRSSSWTKHLKVSSSNQLHRLNLLGAYVIYFKHSNTSILHCEFLSWSSSCSKCLWLALDCCCSSSAPWKRTVSNLSTQIPINQHDLHCIILHKPNYLPLYWSTLLKNHMRMSTWMICTFCENFMQIS